MIAGSAAFDRHPSPQDFPTASRRHPSQSWRTCTCVRFKGCHTPSRQDRSVRPIVPPKVLPKRLRRPWLAGRQHPASAHDIRDSAGPRAAAIQAAPGALVDRFRSGHACDPNRFRSPCGTSAYAISIQAAAQPRSTRGRRRIETRRHRLRFQIRVEAAFSELAGKPVSRQIPSRAIRNQPLRKQKNPREARDFRDFARVFC